MIRPGELRIRQGLFDALQSVDWSMDVRIGNPIDGKGYVIRTRYREIASYTSGIAHPDGMENSGGTLEPIHSIVVNYAHKSVASIEPTSRRLQFMCGKQHFIVHRLNDWSEQHIEREENGKAVWHYYPDTILWRVDQADGSPFVHIVQGSHVSERTGLGVWDGWQYGFYFVRKPDHQTSACMFNLLMAYRAMKSFQGYLEQCNIQDPAATPGACPRNIRVEGKPGL